MNFSQAISNSTELFGEYLLMMRKHFECLIITRPPENWRQGKNGTILILPGFAETWVFEKTLGDSLNRLGFRIYIVDSLGRNVGPINDALQKVKEVIETENLQNFTIVSHSKGGLLAKILLDDPKYSKKIKKIVSIATPYGGSIVGYLRMLSLDELAPRSSILKSLNSSARTNKKIINIYPKIDNCVIPNRNLVLPGAKNICIDVVGHTRILEADETIKAVVSNLK